MARSLRQSGFRRGGTVGEDVNPSAYIVNLADCMLVLACGFLVALITAYHVDIAPAAEEIDEALLEEVNPEDMPENLAEGGGAYYVEAGKVYRDPNTGILYLVENPDAQESGDAAGEAGGSGAAADSAGPAGGTGRATGESQNARANGAD